MFCSGCQSGMGESAQHERSWTRLMRLARTAHLSAHFSLRLCINRSESAGGGGPLARTVNVSSRGVQMAANDENLDQTDEDPSGLSRRQVYILVAVLLALSNVPLAGMIWLWPGTDDLTSAQSPPLLSRSVTIAPEQRILLVVAFSGLLGGSIQMLLRIRDEFSSTRVSRRIHSLVLSHPTHRSHPCGCFLFGRAWRVFRERNLSRGCQRVCVRRNRCSCRAVRRSCDTPTGRSIQRRVPGPVSTRVHRPSLRSTRTIGAAAAGDCGHSHHSATGNISQPSRGLREGEVNFLQDTPARGACRCCSLLQSEDCQQSTRRRRCAFRAGRWPGLLDGSRSSG